METTESRNVPDLLPLAVIEDQPCARDLDIAERLGFERPRNIRNLIERNKAEIEAFGVCFAVKQTSGVKGGRPSQEYWLNEEQSLLVATLSNAPKAAEVRSMLIRTFVAYRCGQLEPPPASGGDLDENTRRLVGGIQDMVTAALREMVPAMVQAHLASEQRRAIPSYVSRGSIEAYSERVFVDLLAIYLREGKNVSCMPGPTYAPAVFANDKRANGITRQCLAQAMSRLFLREEIESVQFGPISKRRSYIDFC